MTGEDLFIAWSRVVYKKPGLYWKQLSPHTQTAWREMGEQVGDLGARLHDPPVEPEQDEKEGWL